LPLRIQNIPSGSPRRLTERAPRIPAPAVNGDFACLALAAPPRASDRKVRSGFRI